MFGEAASDRASEVIVAHNHLAGSLAPKRPSRVSDQPEAARIVPGIGLLDYTPSTALGVQLMQTARL